MTFDFTLFAIGFAVAGALLALWAAWLAKKPAAPRLLRHTPYAILAFVFASLARTFVGVQRSVEVAAGDAVDPAAKAQSVAAASSETMFNAALFAALLLPIVILLVVGTWRYHASAPTRKTAGTR